MSWSIQKSANGDYVILTVHGQYATLTEALRLAGALKGAAEEAEKADRELRRRYVNDRKGG